MKSILCVALLTIPAAHGQARSFSLKKPVIAPLKALPVALHPTKEKIYVSTSGATATDNTKAVQGGKSAAPKVVQPRATAANNWHFSPKFEKGGKADSTFGLMLNHRF
ncbi:MAG: hypothetical protein ABIT37_11005 [Luteolibacter sp.]